MDEIKPNTILGQLKQYGQPLLDSFRVPQPGEPGYVDPTKNISFGAQTPQAPMPAPSLASNSDAMTTQRNISPSGLVGAQGPMVQQEQMPMPSQMANPFLPGFQTQARAISDQMLADQGAARAQGQYAKMVQNEAQKIDNEYKTKIDQNRMLVDQKMQEIEKISSEIKDQGAMNPNKWWQERSTGEKVGAAIAIGLGALGSNLTGSRNLALDQINRAIDLDLMAQEKQMSQKKEGLQAQQSLLGMYMNKTNDLESAKSLAKRDALGLAEMKLNQTLAGVKSQEAKAKGLAMLGQLQNEKAKIDVSLMSKFAEQVQNKNISSGKAVDPMKVPDNMKDQVVRVGSEYRVALNKEAAKEVNQRMPVMDSMQTKINKIQALVEQNPYGYLKLPTKVKGELESLRDQLLLDIKDDRKLGSLDAGSIEVGRNIIGDPIGFFDNNNLAKLKALSSSIESDRQRILQQNVLGYQGLK